MRRFSAVSLFRWSIPGLLALAGCVEAYLPDVVNTNTNYLVVDGFINGNGVTRVKLSRTIPIATTTTPPAETKATIFIVDDAGTRYAVRESSAGLYKSDSMQLNPARQYQLRITTAGGGAATYQSELVPLKVTPSIDKADWQLANEQVQLRMSTHDASGQSRYYRWNFTETWEFNAAFYSELEYFANPGSGQGHLSKRTTPIYTCWRTEVPSTTVQGTSAQLGLDALTNYVVRSIPARAEQFKVRYSVLVSQYAETAQEFAYYELLRKNTEAVGTVNDPLPSQLTGNVHRTDTNTAEPVLGYVSAHTVQYRRLFIDRTDLPARALNYYDTPYGACHAGVSYFCDSNGVCDPNSIINLFRLPGTIPLDFVADPTYGAGISSATAECADCRTRGTNAKPSFW